MAGTQYHRSHPDSSVRHLVILALVAALLYFINSWFLISRYNEINFLRDHLGDMLALPVYLPLTLYLAMRLDIVKSSFKFSAVHVLISTILFSLIFEGFLPSFVESSTRDPMDGLAYLMGGVLVYLVDSIHERHRNLLSHRA
jgi:hypothetical protein